MKKRSKKIICLTVFWMLLYISTALGYTLFTQYHHYANYAISLGELFVKGLVIFSGLLPLAGYHIYKLYCKK
ncbi:MAG: hypothetical protein U9R32_08905 [Bacteroidota bacterium]|nr:hypothetical protein [Bacteroidota bacterium]